MWFPSAGIALWLLLASSRQVEADCTGTISVTGTALEIHNLQGTQYKQEVGKIAFNLDMAGNLNLTSITPTWHCGPLMNFVSSNATQPKGKDKAKEEPQTIHNVGAQLHCYNEPADVDVSWESPWKTVVFYGSLFIELASDGKSCTKPADIVLDYSRCSYNTTTITGRNATGIPCEWTAVAAP
ncbi:secreted protein [Melampsora americana]|nr:secreted protein [Melampsora americana]